MNIWEAIRELINTVEVGTGSTEQDERKVIYLLDFIALHMHAVNPEDCLDEKEIPENDYDAIREIAAERFPNWGFYNTPSDVTKNIAVSTNSVGDAIDDIADIINDLKMVIWSYENEGEKNALWHLQFSYQFHWRWHMRNLQCYLHCLENEI